jgi:hypothetical protein
VCAAVAWVAASAPAFAQSSQPSGGPFSGLFRGSPKDQPHSLDVRGSAFAAWDDNLAAQVPGSGGTGGVNDLDPRFLKQGVANGFQASMAYGFHRRGVKSVFNVNANASVQEFASQLGGGALWFHNYDASAALTTKLTTKTSLNIATGVGYTPYYQYLPFLKNTTSEESPVGSDYGFAVDSELVRSTSASANLANQFSKRSSISAGVDWQLRVIPGNEDLSADTRDVRVTFNHSVTRKLGFHIGYGIQESRYLSRPDAKPVRTNLMDIGLGYADGLTLSLGRRTTLGMSIGASLAKNGDPVSVAATGKDTAFVVTGSATLVRSLSRAWAASLGYQRGTSYVVGFTTPVMADSVNAGVGGPLTTRLQFSTGAGASRGQQLFSDSGGRIVSYTASSRLTYGVFTHLGLYCQASYYRFSIPPGFTNFGFVPDLDRRSVSVGLTTWLALIKPPRTRRIPNDQTTTGQQ